MERQVTGELTKMGAAWNGTVGEMIKHSTANALIPMIIGGYRQRFAKEPGDGEISSWKHSAALLCEVLTDPKWHALKIIFEYAMPSGEQRADIIVLGGTDDSPRGLIIELKRWSSFYNFSPSSKEEYRYVLLTQTQGEKALLHPLLQVRQYAEQIQNFSKVGSQFNWSCLALLPNMQDASVKRLLRSTALPKNSRNKLLGASNYRSRLQQELAFLLPVELSDEITQKFNDSPYIPSDDLVGKLIRCASALESKAGTVLEVADIVLTDRQESICRKICSAIEGNKTYLFLIEGGPGSGKTYIALLLLLRSLRDKKIAQMALYNSRLLAVLRYCLETEVEGASTLLANVSSVKHQLRKSSLDLLICDEAQRLTLSDAEAFIVPGRVTVLLYDEEQTLNPGEQGSKKLFERMAAARGIDVVDTKLEQMMRCRGGLPYQQWVEQVIRGHEAPIDHACPPTWNQDYEFKIVRTCEDMVHSLAERGVKNKVVITASFTESKGNWNNGLASDNIRYQGEQLKLYWRMHNHDYAHAWTYGRAEDLNRVCSIYGAQGLESDYVGVIWGRDYIFDGDKFVTGEPENCFDDRLILSNKWCDNALRFLRNRYRIFLTRGRLGTIVWCEDDGTRRYLERVCGSSGINT